MRAIVDFVLRNAYRKEIIFVLVLKFFLLAVLWELFFSHPIDEILTKEQLVQHFTRHFVPAHELAQSTPSSPPPHE